MSVVVQSVGHAHQAAERVGIGLFNAQTGAVIVHEGAQVEDDALAEIDCVTAEDRTAASPQGSSLCKGDGFAVHGAVARDFQNALVDGEGGILGQIAVAVCDAVFQDQGAVVQRRFSGNIEVLRFRQAILPLFLRFSCGLGDQLVRLLPRKADGSAEFRSRSLIGSGIHVFGLVEVIDDVVIFRSVAFIAEGVIKSDCPSFLGTEYHAVHGNASVGSEYKRVQNRVVPSAFFRVAFHDDISLVCGEDGILVIKEHGPCSTVNGVVLNEYAAAVVDEFQPVGCLKRAYVPLGRVSRDGDLSCIDEGRSSVH